MDLKPLSGDAAEGVQADMRKALSSFVGANFAINSFLTERVDETLSGYTAPFVGNVFGNDLDQLDKAAQAISRVLASLPGSEEVQVQSPPGLPQLTIRLRTADLERWGLDPVGVLDDVRAAYQGDVVGQVQEGGATFNVTALLAPAIRAQVPLPPGTYLEFAGTAQAQSQSQHALLLNGLLAGVGIVLLLSVVTRNWRNLLLVLANLPFALVGGVLAGFATGGLLSLGSMVGFVTLFGITLRNSIMMISHYEHLVEAEGRSWGAETAVEGAADRLAPILMTSLVTALGLLPLAIGMGDPAREIEGPMAVVILGGLLTSMALNLLVLPTLAFRFGRFEAARDEFEPMRPAAQGAGIGSDD